jgi:hypothetical protein
MFGFDAVECSFAEGLTRPKLAIHRGELILLELYIGFW